MEYNTGKDFDEQFKTANVGEFFDFVSAPRQNKKSNKCPVCGYTSKQFLETGFLGCSECYKHLFDVVKPAIIRLFGKDEHVIVDDFTVIIEPKKWANYAQSEKQDVNELKHRLKKAVLKEDYAWAAKLKKEIDELKGSGDE